MPGGPAATGNEPSPGAIQAFTPGLDQAPSIVVPGVRFIRFSAPFAARLADAMAAPEDEIHERRAMGNRAGLALLPDESIAGYGWVSYDAVRISELDIEVPIPRGHAYIWDCATLPAHRGRRIFPALLTFLVEDLRRQGIVQIWAAVAPGNQVSLNAFRRAGFRRVASSFITPGRLEAVPTSAATAEEAAVLRALRVTR